MIQGSDNASAPFTPSQPWFLRSAWRLYASLFLLIAIPAGLLVLSIAVHVRSQLETALREQNELLSRLLAIAIDEEMQGLKGHVAVISTRALLREAILRNDPPGVTVHLKALVESNPRIARVFVADASGELKFDYPHDPSVIGVNFSHRDWHRGVAALDAPYISEIYRRAALEQPYVVSIAAPVRDAEQNTIAYIVGQYELHDLRRRMATLAPSETSNFAIVDQNGRVATASLGHDADDRPAILPTGLDFSSAGSKIVTFHDGDDHLVSISPIPSTQWMAVAHTSMDAVTTPVRALLMTIGVLFALTSIGMAVLGGAFTRMLWRYNTALRRTDADLRLAKMAADDANHTKSEFLANMSHEIRTPMMAIMGYTDLLSEPSRTREERLEAVRVIRRNSDHLLAIINDILDLSKIEAGEMRTEGVECSPCRVLHDVFSLMRVRASEKGLEFKTRVEGVVPETVRSDPTRLRQILINLVGNAIKFTDAGRVCITAQLVEPTGDGEPALRIDVADTGIGMSEQQLSRLFQPFAQADTSTTRRFGGTGLGLAISDRLARMLGGRIEVNSSLGRGSTFSLVVATGPLDGVRRLRNCREALLDQDLDDRADTKPLRLEARILLVEDGKDNRDLLAHYLRSAGAHVVEAEHGKVACDLVETCAARGETFDAVLLDMQMPVLDGYSTAQRMRESGFDKPIIALTANAMAHDRERCIRAGCTDYLSKPVMKRDLLRALASHVPTRKAPGVSDRNGDDAASSQPLVSCLDDEGIRPFLDGFIAGLPSRAAELQECLAADDIKAISDLVHQIKGSGGLFGFVPLTSQAEAAEEAILRGRSIEAIRDEVEALISLLRRVRPSADLHEPAHVQPR